MPYLNEVRQSLLRMLRTPASCNCKYRAWNVPYHEACCINHTLRAIYNLVNEANLEMMNVPPSQ